MSVVVHGSLESMLIQACMDMEKMAVELATPDDCFEPPDDQAYKYYLPESYHTLKKVIGN